MAVTEMFTLGLAKINGAAAVTLGQLGSHGITPGIQPIVMRGAGEVSPSFSGLELISPVIPIVTSDLKLIIDALGLNFGGTGRRTLLGFELQQLLLH